MNVGHIVQVIGSTVDVAFDPDKLPKILTAIKIEDKDRGIRLTVEAALHIGDNIVRCIAMSSTDGLVRGMPAVDTGAPISVPVGEECLGRIFNLVGETIDNRGPVKTEKTYPIHRSSPSFEDQQTNPQQFVTRALHHLGGAGRRRVFRDEGCVERGRMEIAAAVSS